MARKSVSDYQDRKEYNQTRQREWRAANKERDKANKATACRTYRERHVEEKKAYNRAYYEAHAEEMRAYNGAYGKEWRTRKKAEKLAAEQAALATFTAKKQAKKSTAKQAVA